MWSRIVNRSLITLGARILALRDKIGVRSLPTFANQPRDVTFRWPYEIDNPHLIHVGDGSRFGPGTVLRASRAYPGRWLAHPSGQHLSQTFTPELVLGERVTATASLQIAAFARVTVEDDVMFAGNVFVSDATHGSVRGDVPYKYQGMTIPAPVRIGRGSWIGQNVVVMPGVTIGAYCVVGANSVVTQDIPEGSVAVGVPARVVRRWDPATGHWGSAANPAAPAAGSKEPRVAAPSGAAGTGGPG